MQFQEVQSYRVRSNSKSLGYGSLIGNGSLDKSSSEECLQPAVDQKVNATEQYHADVKK